jgi:hypothetical protein
VHRPGRVLRSTTNATEALPACAIRAVEWKSKHSLIDGVVVHGCKGLGAQRQEAEMTERTLVTDALVGARHHGTDRRDARPEVHA